MARRLIYIDTKKSVEIGDEHRLNGWKVKVVGMQEVEKETFGNGSVTIAHCQGAAHGGTIYASNIGAEWVST